MQYNIEKAIKFTFEDPRWLHKLAPLLIIQVVVSIISFLAQIDPFMIFTGMLILSLPLIIPYSLYLRGYNTEIIENTMNSNPTPLPEHNNFGYKFKLWGYLFLVSLGPVIVFTLAGILVFVPLTFATIYAFIEINIVVGIMAVMLMIFLGMIFTILLMVYSATLYPAMLYIFLKTKSLNATYNISNIYNVLSKSWKDLVIAYLIIYGLSVVGRMIGLATWAFLLGWLVTPAMHILVSFIAAYILGDTFKQLSEEGLLKELE